MSNLPSRQSPLVFLLSGKLLLFIAVFSRGLTMLIATIAARAAFYRGRFREIHFAIIALDHLCDAMGAVLLQTRAFSEQKPL